MAEAQFSIAGSKCQFGVVDMDPRRVGKAKATNLSRLIRCWICLASLRRLQKSEFWRSSNICVEFRRNSNAYEAAAPTAGFRAGGVQRKAAPNLFHTLIEAIADVR